MVLTENAALHPPWIGIGFTGEGAQVIDARGFATRILPRDISFWNRS